MLSERKMKHAQKQYRFFVFFNVISFSLITGNILQLFALKLGAGVGLLSFIGSMISVTFIFSIFGRGFISKYGAVKIRGYFWLFRYLMMIPLVFLIIPELRNSKVIVYVIILFGVLGFNIFKGMALAAQKPINGWISKESERASFLAVNRIITFSVSILLSLLMAVALGKESPLYIYTLFFIIGIIAGIIGSLFILKLPEPEGIKKHSSHSLLQSMKNQKNNKSFLRLLVLVAVSNISVIMIASFLILYFKTIFNSSDSSIVFFTVAGSFGALAMALISRFITDRVGSKPMYFTYHLLNIFILVLIIAAPNLRNRVMIFIFMAFTFFAVNMSSMGINVSADVYFFSITEGKDRMNMGIIYNLARGLSGALGAFTGGIILSSLQNTLPAENPALAFQIFFAIAGIILFVNLFLIKKLPDVSDFSISQVLSIIFSPRDLKAIWFLNKLDKTKNQHDEKDIMVRMAGSKSGLVRKELLKKLRSPNLFIKIEALSSLKRYPLNSKVEKLLVKEVKDHPFTTAHLAAQMLGDFKLTNSKDVLREALKSPDYLLRAKAAYALAQIGDADTAPKMREMLIKTKNPREIIYISKALDLLKDYESLPVVLNKSIEVNYAHIGRELASIASSFLDMNEWFSTYFSLFLTDQKKAYVQVLSEVPKEMDNRVLDDPNALLKEVIVYLRKKTGKLNLIKIEDDILEKPTMRFLLYTYYIYVHYLQI